jgi:type II secretory pathway component GspD/PulD (secretin)
VADGYSVHLAVTFSIKEFLGHDKPDAALEQAAHGKGVNAQSPLPRYRVQDLTTTATVPDGQTLVIHGGLKGESGVRQPGGTEARKPDKAPRKDFLVFITPTIIDQAGNRVHTDEEVSQRTNAGLTNQPAFPDTPR